MSQNRTDDVDEGIGVSSESSYDRQAKRQKDIKMLAWVYIYKYIEFSEYVEREKERISKTGAPGI